MRKWMRVTYGKKEAWYVIGIGEILAVVVRVGGWQPLRLMMLTLIEKWRVAEAVLRWAVLEGQA